MGTVAGVARGSVVGEVVLRGANSAGPRPAAERAEDAEVSKAGLAPREEVALVARGRRRAALVCGGEGGDSDTPRHGAGLVERRLGGEAGEAGAHRHCHRASLELWIRRRDKTTREISGMLLRQSRPGVLGWLRVELVLIGSKQWQLIRAVYCHLNSWDETKQSDAVLPDLLHYSLIESKKKKSIALSLNSLELIRTNGNMGFELVKKAFI